MNIIPIHLLPKSLKQEIFFKNISKIEILHKKRSALYINTLVFIKRYGPPIKYYNENLKWERKLDETRKTPIIHIYGKDASRIASVESGNLLPDEIFERIQKLDEENVKKIE